MNRDGSLNALSSIVCFLTQGPARSAGQGGGIVSMPSRALYAF